MLNLSEILKTKKRVLTGSGATKQAILDAETALGLQFASDYREYLEQYGIVAYDGHELTGLTRPGRMNVIDATKDEKVRSKVIPRGFYVIERTGIEEIIVWQDESGAIYYSSPNAPVTKMCESLADYISK